ncbi:glutathione S-transferase C-terminal-like protein [Phlebopus sp. FC_14]|nr:glutathione S-transferase C-terminal-like protein [Phlebopus sp. FC_14]
MSQQITLYTAKICPYAQRVEIALAEAKADFKSYLIDLTNKPEWYLPKVNPAGKASLIHALYARYVPSIAYGGPDVPPDSPSPESTKLAESLILVEFVADLFPSSNILPTDPVLRAKARFFIETVSTKFNSTYMGFLARGEPYQKILDGAVAVQDLLPESGPYAVGDQYTIADIAFTPFFARLKIAAENDIGKYESGEGKKLWEALQEPKYARFNAYVNRLLERPSFKATFDEEYVKGAFSKRFGRS